MATSAADLTQLRAYISSLKTQVEALKVQLGATDYLYHTARRENAQLQTNLAIAWDQLTVLRKEMARRENEAALAAESILENAVVVD
jgi:hypothetical protein